MNSHAKSSPDVTARAEVFKARSKAMVKLSLFAMALTALNVGVSYTGVGSKRYLTDTIAGVGIFASFALAALLAKREKLYASIASGAVGLVLSVILADLLYGSYTDRLIYILLAVLLPGFGLKERALVYFYLFTLLCLVALVGLMPGEFRIGTSEFRTFVLDLTLVFSGAVVLFWTNVRQTNVAIHELSHKQQEAEHQRALAERAASHAEIANNSKSMFLANVSHELRTPLNAILGYVELIQEEEQDRIFEGEEALYEEELCRVHRAARQLLVLIDDVLDLSKVEAGRLEIVASEFELFSLLDELTRLIKPLAAAHGNTLSLHAEGERRLMLSTDKLRLRQVLLNLLSNAVKFTHQGRIDIFVEETPCEGSALGERWVELRVQDTGAGMSEEQVERIFEPFLQGSVETAHAFGGTGLGLALSRRICTLLQGTIRVESEGIGQGSTFFIHIPCVFGRGPLKAADLGAQAVT